MWKRSILVVAAAGLWSGCASAGPPEPRRDPAVLTWVELEESNREDVFSAVRQLRPLWLRARGRSSFNSDASPQVYVDGVRLGGIDELRNIRTDAVERLEFYDARRAQARFGPGHLYGVIAVVTRSY